MSSSDEQKTNAEAIHSHIKKENDNPENITPLNVVCNQISILSEGLDLDGLVLLINDIRLKLHEISPFKDNPVDYVKWVKCDEVISNDYNPNKVAPPEMKLLELSIMNDGYTQPIVAWSGTDKDGYEVIDGFHRSRVGKESNVVGDKIFGYLPIVDIRNKRSDKKDRIASTIRHNRARGKHQIDAMSEIVIELKNRNWRNKRIANELGMDEEEVLRLCQISGLESLFSDADFSNAWESSDAIDDWVDLSDQLDIEELGVRTVNTSDPNRIFHTYHKWECHKAGFYATSLEGSTADECKQQYAEFLSNDDLFRGAANKVISEWTNSCEHYLTNTAMNRIAWIGQAAMCYHTGVPSKYCSGFNLLTEEKKEAANLIALDVLNDWLIANELDSVDMDDALSYGRQMEIY